ncbi:sigma factor-like helix-turn-helix DNA-binding protein [Novosphingobium huizhouense]|uniref:sigma factor-like helix-turn-helix DNA-binding protein n=1 Tax=Novosphingobium huizhouense TaxID=2866625 RepID=UPI001CD8DC05|nr:sigma factor-like helix-turn-helix DNA-binding protein [Novosphingobium huizhouense]
MQIQRQKGQAPCAPARRAGFDWEGAMRAAQAGDADAYRALLAASAAWLRRFFARRLAPDAVEDAVQECLIALHARRATFTPGRPYLPWLTAIARYKWVDALRLAGRQAADELVEAPIDGHESPVLAAISVATLLGQLRTAQAEVIRLVKLEGMSIREASAATGQSESLVKVNIHRGLIAMRAALGLSAGGAVSAV